MNSSFLSRKVDFSPPIWKKNATVKLDHLPSAGESTRMEIRGFRQFLIGEVTLREIVVEIYENPTKKTNDLFCKLSMQYMVDNMFKI